MRLSLRSACLALVVPVLVACTAQPVDGPATPAVTPTAPVGTADASPTPATASPEPAALGVLGNLTPYPAPSGPGTAAGPGEGYAVVFTETLTRHGSRSLTSEASSTRALALWAKARRTDALTDRGRRFGPAAERETAAMTALGWGALSGRGEQEQRAMGRRQGERLTTFFADVQRTGDRVEVIDTGVPRTIASARQYVAGLRSTRAGLDVAKPVSSSRLHFGSTNVAYQKFLRDDRTWKRAYASASPTADLEQAARDGLRLLYTADFVDALDDPIAEGRAVWDLCRVQPAMAEEFATSMTEFLDPAMAEAFTFDDDARFFYSRGPGVPGDGRSHDVARPLLRDFVSTAQARLDGGTVAAVFRFAHDLEVAPFSALLELPAARPLPDRGTVFSRSTSEFAAERVYPLAATVEWTLWRDGAGSVVMQVRSNEVATTLGHDCTETSPGSRFYAWDEVVRCLPVD